MTEQTNIPVVGEQQINLLEKLTNACSVSGDEGAVRAMVLEQVRPLAEARRGQVKIDALGNVLVTLPGQQPERQRVMLAAHMDEVGFMITNDEGEGIFRFDAVGGLDAKILVGKTVWVGRDQVPGVIGAKPIHLTTAEERKSAISLEVLRIDVGPANGGKVKVGDRATFATRFTDLGASFLAKALDDRLGVATLIELLRFSPPNIDLLAAFTVQEENGLRGAQVAAHAFDPQLAIVLDCTPARDLPAWDGGENTDYNTRQGAGPAIYIADRSTLSDPRLVRHLVETAERHAIPYQIRQTGGGGTDAGAIHKARVGIPSVSVSVPGRHLHTPASIARRSDWEHTLALIAHALRDLTPAVLDGER